jgi:hypothetical protein
MADRHGIRLAPLYNSDGPIEIQLTASWKG